LQKMNLNPDDKKYLDQFGQYDRSLISNLFLAAVRNGLHSPESVTAHVKADGKNRLRRYPERDKERLLLLLSTIDTEQAALYAAYCISYEALPRSEREKLKSGRNQMYVQQAMEQKPPSPAQLSFLTTLGHRGKAPETMLEASQIINALKGKSL